MLVCKAVIVLSIVSPKKCFKQASQSFKDFKQQKRGNAFMHIFILNKKLVFCFAKAQNSSLEQILQE